jgi:hypothetical protein
LRRRFVCEKVEAWVFDGFDFLKLPWVGRLEDGLKEDSERFRFLGFVKNASGISSGGWTDEV